jgi:hypothetical protein
MGLYSLKCENVKTPLVVNFAAHLLTWDDSAALREPSTDKARGPRTSGGWAVALLSMLWLLVGIRLLVAVAMFKCCAHVLSMPAAENLFQCAAPCDCINTVHPVTD